MLTPPKKHQDSIVQTLLSRNQEGEQKEEANLLYVALTRAKQFLFISGCKPSRGDNLGWYGHIRQQLQRHLDIDSEDEPLILETGESVTVHEPIADNTDTCSQGMPEPDPRLKGPFNDIKYFHEIAPSYQQAFSVTKDATQWPEPVESSAIDEDKQTRGSVIHRILYLLCEQFTEADIRQQILSEYGIDLTQNPFGRWFTEAHQVTKDNSNRFLYDPAQYTRAYNEVSILYQQGSDTVYGFIDRLIVTSKKLIIVDYKTHETDNLNEVDALINQYKPQLHLYKQGVEKCWHDLPVECYLLFTHARHLALAIP